MAFMTAAERAVIVEVRNALRDSPIEHPIPENQVKALARVSAGRLGYAQMQLEEELRDHPVTALLTGILAIDDAITPA